jgi:hypothetical protein
MLQTSFTWSKSIDNASSAYPTQDYLGDGVPQIASNLHLSRGLSNFDIPKRFLLTAIYELPFGKARRDFVSRYLISGWQIAATAIYQSGVPISIFSGPVLGVSDVNLDGNTTGGVAADNTLANCQTGGNGLSLLSQFSSSYTYSQALLGQNGTCGRNIARQPGLFNLNTSVSKSLVLTEYYNTLNNPSFFVASVNNLYVSNPTTFGQLAALPQRKAEMAIRLLW